MSPRRVIREKKAHCIEGALFAATALMLQGEKPLIMNFKVIKGDEDHIVTLFKRNGYWGAISKTNHAVLRFRDPVYKTVRELAMSYFHEYFLNANGKKTMRGYSPVINLRSFGTTWIIREDDLWEIAETIFDMKHIPVIPPKNMRHVRNASILEQAAASIVDWQPDGSRLKKR